MRIGIDARFYGGEQSKGLGRYTQKLIEHLLQLTTEHTFVIFLQEEAFHQWEHTQENVEVVLAPYQWYSMTEQLYMPLKIKQHNVDFMHFPHFNVPIFYNGPFIVTIHDLIISRFPTERATTLGPMMYKFKQFAYNRVIQHAARRAKKIITVSEYSKQDIMDFFKLPAEHIEVTYEAVDGFVTPPETKNILERYGIHQPYLLYVGNAYPHKNLETLLKVMAKLKKEKKLFCNLVLVGKSDYFYLRLQQQAWALDVEDCVQFVGFVPDAELAALYQGALVYLFPSKYEGFGLPPLEAMYYGTPVISSNTSCLPEILGEAALYFNFQDVDGIIQQVLRLQADQNLRSVLVEKGYEQVKQYNWRTMAKSTLRIYESTFAKS